MCDGCLAKRKHGHHPAHTFQAQGQPSQQGLVASLCKIGRNACHPAICDGCDTNIYGVRHKCLNCPDWDFCNNCIAKAGVLHPGHRFVPIYESISEPLLHQQRHYGIYCDGHLCENKQTFIVGDRYKCAVCHDTDFCANCEASPLSTHNRTHPLIKFKTPVTNCSIETVNTQDQSTHGDRVSLKSVATETTAVAESVNAATQVQTVAETTPVVTEPKVDTAGISGLSDGLCADYVRDTVEDGTAMDAGTSFTQTWTLYNGSSDTPWPVGSSVRFIGGDRQMLNVDNLHPSPAQDLLQAKETNKLTAEIAPHGSCEFKVQLKAPPRPGRYISYWRMKTPDGRPFGHKLWCDIVVNSLEPALAVNSRATGSAQDAMHNELMAQWVERVTKQGLASLKSFRGDDVTGQRSVEADLANKDSTLFKEYSKTLERVKADMARALSEAKAVADEKEKLAEEISAAKKEFAVAKEELAAAQKAAEAVRSNMIFPKLEKESPVSSFYEAAEEKDVKDSAESQATATSDEKSVFDDMESLTLEDATQTDDEDYLDMPTDDEYEVIDASDEEYLATTGRK